MLAFAAVASDFDCPPKEADDDAAALGAVDAIETPTVASSNIARARFPRAVSMLSSPFVRSAGRSKAAFQLKRDG